MPRSEEANMQIKDERQQRILSSALKVFIRKGFAATKISDIAVEAGMSNGLMYHYFQSKEEIYAELVRRAAMFSRRLLEQSRRTAVNPSTSCDRSPSASFAPWNSSRPVGTTLS